MESELPECTLGIITVTFSGTKPDGTRARATFKGRARVYGDCWTVTDRVKPNETIAPENLLQLTCEWNGLRTSPILDRSRTAGKCAVRTLVPGRPILQSDLREKPIVQSGSPVTVVFERDGIRVKLDGIAMMDGGRGEQIPVRIPEIQKNRLTGVIHDERTLYWVP
ncbi:MAG: flagellar basal body P-ring formation protein FlgA [Calditrichaeota bacterium]|nr:flagellar basal body P-ring formation protein FlgA [Calditrichota bacterium]